MGPLGPRTTDVRSPRESKGPSLLMAARVRAGRGHDHLHAGISQAWVQRRRLFFCLGARRTHATERLVRSPAQFLDPAETRTQINTVGAEHLVEHASVDSTSRWFVFRSLSFVSADGPGSAVTSPLAGSTHLYDVSEGVLLPEYLKEARPFSSGVRNHLNLAAGFRQHQVPVLEEMRH